jgi:DNA-binding Lrp family transcriptional regulator
MPKERINCDIMVEAIVLVNTEFDSSQKQVLENLQETSGVHEAYATSYGVYDFVAKVQTRTVDDLRSKVLESIGKIDAADSTTTLVVYQK